MEDLNLKNKMDTTNQHKKQEIRNVGLNGTDTKQVAEGVSGSIQTPATLLVIKT